MKIAIFVAYFAVLVILGWVSMKKTKTLDDFFLGGRTLGPWMSAFAYGATYFSAVVFIGYAGEIGWGFGLSGMWIAIGNAIVGSFLAWKILGRPTRSMTARLKAITMPEFLAARFDSKWLKVVSALIIFIFLVPYSSGVYMGLSYFIESVLGIPFTVALVLIAVVTGIYLVLGGYFAVTLADMFQGFIMIFGVIALVATMVKSPEVGGITNVYSGLKSIDPDLVSLTGKPGFWKLAPLVLLTSLGTWAMPQMTQKFYSIKSEKQINVAAWVTLGICLVIVVGAYFNGALSHFFFSDLSEVGNNMDKIVPIMIEKALHPILATFILVLVLAASMSTLASLVLVSSSAIAVDLVKTIKPNASDKFTVTLMRILCLVFIAFALYIAIKPNGIVNLMSFSWGAVAGSFLAPYVYGLFSKRVTKAGIWAGLITGLVLNIVLTITMSSNVPLAGCIAMLVPFIVIPVVSTFTPKYDSAHIKKVFND